MHQIRPVLVFLTLSCNLTLANISPPAKAHHSNRRLQRRSSAPPLLSRVPGFFSFVTPGNATSNQYTPSQNHSHSETTADLGPQAYNPETNKKLCDHQPLKRALWKQFNMNAYLDHYPGGESLSLERYASRVGAVDFQCGIGKVCDPGQLCEAVYGKDWYALVAAQNWNNFVNILYEASGDAFAVISDILPTMLIDLEPDPTRTPRHITAYIGLLSNWISSFPASLFKSIGPIAGSIWSWGTISWIVLVMAFFQLSALGWLETLVIVGNGEDRFTRSSDVTWMLGQAQHAVQGAISNITQQVISSGISSPQGLASINRDGVFLSSYPVVDRETVQKQYEKVLKLKTLIKLWRIQQAFIVRGADPCTQGGPNGAFDDPEKLSYCDEDAIMMSIVRGDPKKGDAFDPTIFRASLVESKYGFTTEYLTTTSWQCQQKYNIFDFDPYSYRNSTDLVDPHMQEDCIVNIPVCDCTKPEMIKALKNGISITKACREINGLPI